jgi:hypothetical protein
VAVVCAAPFASKGWWLYFRAALEFFDGGSVEWTHTCAPTAAAKRTTASAGGSITSSGRWQIFKKVKAVSC